MEHKQYIDRYHYIGNIKLPGSPYLCSLILPVHLPPHEECRSLVKCVGR